MYHSFLIHSFTDGYLGCFQHLVTVNNAAMNIGVHRFFLNWCFRILRVQQQDLEYEVVPGMEDPDRGAAFVRRRIPKTWTIKWQKITSCA